MDPITQMIVDILRRGKETEALNQGGAMAGAPTAQPMMPRAVEPKHAGRSYDDIVAQAELG